MYMYVVDNKDRTLSIIAKAIINKFLKNSKNLQKEKLDENREESKNCVNSGTVNSIF